MIGVDEVGRGAWAGPLLVAAVRLHNDVPGLTDSKLLSRKKRESMALVIKQSADIGLGWVSAEQLDQIGLSESLRQACRVAVEALRPGPDEEILDPIDGTVNFLPGTQTTLQPRAELVYPAVAAASILAKVLRDSYMRQLHAAVPDYAFDSHVGYGTRMHVEALARLGSTVWHRKSFKPVAQFASATMAA